MEVRKRTKGKIIDGFHSSSINNVYVASGVD
jgi:hypothetical protein